MKPGSRGALGAGAVCLCTVAEIRFLREHLLSALRTSGAGRVSSPCHPAPARGRRATSYKSLPCVGARDSSLPTPALQSRQRLWARSEAGPAPARRGVPAHHHGSESSPGHLLTQAVTRCQHQPPGSASAFSSKRTVCLGHGQRCP